MSGDLIAKAATVTAPVSGSTAPGQGEATSAFETTLAQPAAIVSLALVSNLKSFWVWGLTGTIPGS